MTKSNTSANPHTPTLKIICAEGGSGEHTVEAQSIQVPDLWHVAQELPEPHRSMIFECWHLCHDLKNFAQGTGADMLAALQEVVANYDYGGGQTDSKGNDFPDIAAARAVIARATGGAK